MGNVTNGTTPPPTARVTSDIGMTVSMEVPSTAAGKTVLGNAFAYGLHAAACASVKGMWATLGKCMMGESNSTGVTFDMALSIAPELKMAGNTAAPCTKNDCYGDDAPARRMAEVALKNSGTFGVEAKGAAALKVVDQAETALKTQAAAAKAAPSLIAATTALYVDQAVTRPAMAAAVKSAGINTTAVSAAVSAAKITISAPKKTSSLDAPAGTSSAYTAGVAGVVSLIAGALLF